MNYYPPITHEINPHIIYNTLQTPKPYNTYPIITKYPPYNFPNNDIINPHTLYPIHHQTSYYESDDRVVTVYVSSDDDSEDDETENDKEENDDKEKHGDRKLQGHNLFYNIKAGHFNLVNTGNNTNASGCQGNGGVNPPSLPAPKNIINPPPVPAPQKINPSSLPAPKNIINPPPIPASPKINPPSSPAPKIIINLPPISTKEIVNQQPVPTKENINQHLVLGPTKQTKEDEDEDEYENENEDEDEDDDDSEANDYETEEYEGYHDHEKCCNRKVDYMYSTEYDEDENEDDDSTEDDDDWGKHRYNYKLPGHQYYYNIKAESLRLVNSGNKTNASGSQRNGAAKSYSYSRIYR